jgi:hypothetical protein
VDGRAVDGHSRRAWWWRLPGLGLGLVEFETLSSWLLAIARKPHSSLTVSPLTESWPTAHEAGGWRKGLEIWRIGSRSTYHMPNG